MEATPLRLGPAPVGLDRICRERIRFSRSAGAALRKRRAPMEQNTRRDRLHPTEGVDPSPGTQVSWPTVRGRGRPVETKDQLCPGGENPSGVDVPSGTRSGSTSSDELEPDFPRGTCRAGEFFPSQVLVEPTFIKTCLIYDGLPGLGNACNFYAMNHRFRFLAALLALIGLLTFSVQGAWAATCAVNMETESSSLAADPLTQAPSCADMGAGAHAEDVDFPDGDSGPAAPHCPAMPMGVAGACGAVLATLSDASPVLTPPLVEAQISPRMDSVRESLLAGVFFRPPIA